MDATTKERIARFLEDSATATAVYNVLLDSFLANHGEKDVTMLAARAMSVDFLKLGWKELAKYKAEAEREPKPQSQIGM